MNDDHCTAPPEGWMCSREAGHSGPCAAYSLAPVEYSLAPVSDPLDDHTVVELIAETTERLRFINRTEYRVTADRLAPNREFALAITHLEDAQMRYTRGRAIQLGRFNPADLDK